MNTAIPMISTGTAVPTTFPVGVSPISLATAPPTAVAIAPAMTKMITAAITLGR